MLYYPKRGEAFYSIFFFLRVLMYYPSPSSDKKKLRILQWFLIRSFTIFNFVCIGVHLTMSLKNGSFPVIIEDLALGSGYISIFIGFLLFRRSHKLWSQFLRNLTDFRTFKKPENYDIMVKRLNILSLAGALYALAGIYMFARLKIVNHEPCQKMNELHGLNEICGLLWLYLFHFGLMALSLEPGYLDFDNLPDTNFTCVGKVIGGYYADLEANCQMFHVCTIGQADEPMDIRFLCLNGTVFDQETRVCERIDEVDCSKSEQFYSLNLELYGNSGPILEESPENAQETESPSIIIKSTTSTTTTTPKSTRRPSNSPATPPYYTTISPPAVTTAANKPKVVSTLHFPVNAPDIRFNPEEINISLNPGAPPDIRTKHFLHQSFSDSSEDILSGNVNSDDGQSIKVQKPERLHVSSSTSPSSIYSIDNSNQKLPRNGEHTFRFSEEGYQTELPQRQQQFLIQTNSFRHSQSFPPNVDHNANQYHHQNFHSTTAKQENNYRQDSAHTTLRTIYLHSLKPPQIHQHHHYTHHHHTEKPPQRVQIPIPLLPTLPPLTFSSPAPFTLQRHIETKRYTKDHHSPPRIIISASASVSDASGRRLNYSLGTIGAAQILQAPPSSYDDYKDSDVGLDPFYHDVPKINQKRRKRRSTGENEEKINPFDIIKNEKEAVDVLKFLFTWYQSHQATATVPPVTSPVTPDLIHKINHEFAAKDSDGTFLTDSSESHLTTSKESSSTESLQPKYENSDLFKKNGRYSIIGGYKNLHLKSNVNERSSFKNPVKLEKLTENARIVKNVQIDDPVTDIVSDISELKEKMDDAEVTVVKDLKEAYFNPYDYVDDNYEGVAYKEHSPNKTKENNTIYTYLPNTEENTKNIRDQNISFSINPAAVAELYKYFNLNRDHTTETDIINSSIEDNINSENKNSPNSEHVTTNDNDNEKIETLLKNRSNTEILGQPFKSTEINVLSEVHEGDEIFKSSSTTSTTSTTTTTERSVPRNSGLKRGRGRQRQHIENYSERQKNLNTFFIPTESHKIDDELEPKVKNLEKSDTHNLIQQSSTTRSHGGRGRKRGRSRFIDYHSSTSTTTESSTVENIVLTENSKENSATESAFSIIPILLEPTRGTILEATTLEEGVTVPTLNDFIHNGDITHKESTRENNIAEQYKKFKTSTFPPNVYHFTKETTSDKNDPFNILAPSNISEIISHGIISSSNNNYKEVNDIPRENKNTIKSLNAEIIKTQENQFDDSITENYLFVQDTFNDTENIPTENVISDFETVSLTDSEHFKTSTTASIDNERDRLRSNKEINENTVTTDTEYVQFETSTTTSLSKETDNFDKPKETLKLLSQENSVVETTDDSSYLIKLLRYFADTAVTPKEESLITETSAQSYFPLTESQITTTEKTLVPTHRRGKTRNKFTEQKRGRQRNEHRNSLRVRTTSLPTLRDISEHLSSSEIEVEHENAKHAVSNDTPINDSTLISTNKKLVLNVPDPELVENISIKTKSDLLERLTLIEQNLKENSNNDPVTKAPVVDTTVTTPFISFEQPESFGTTFSSITEPTKSDYSSTEIPKDLTYMFETDTKTNQFFAHVEPTEKTNNLSFYEDFFVVPELAKNSSLTAYSEADTNSKQTALLEPTPTLTTSRNDEKLSSYNEELDKLLLETTPSIELDSTTSYPHKTKSPLIIKVENDLNKPVNNKKLLHPSDLSTLQPDVEIQKSISLPVSVLETTFDISQDINNAQDINDLVSTLPISEPSSTLRTTEKMQEYIQDIEEFTKSVVAKDDQIKFGFTDGYGLSATETVPTTLITTEAAQTVSDVTTIETLDEHEKGLKHLVVPEVLHNATEILFVKDTESPKTSDNDSTTNIPNSVAVGSPGIVNSSHLLQVVVETTTIDPVTTPLTTKIIPYHTRKTRPPKRRPYNNQNNQFGRHRFSTELFTNKPPKHDDVQPKLNLFSSQTDSENITDAPLHRSATPTRSELKKVSLHTTPLSSKSSRFPSKVSKHYVFNCFGKEKNKFYADPRDCRLFHYCTQGYSKNQLLDLKFVCDQKTFFDEDKLTCTKVKPTRCL